jgi:spastin
MWKLVETLQAAVLGAREGDMADRPSGAGPAASPVLGNVDGERVVEKLKRYFGLGKGEIDKAVRADEWGLVEDALLHYRNANRILSEGVALPAMVESSR